MSHEKFFRSLQNILYSCIGINGGLEKGKQPAYYSVFFKFL